MTDSNYLQRAFAMDALAVNVATTLIQSLTLIHGGAMVAIPAFANQFEVVLRPSIGSLPPACFAFGNQCFSCVIESEPRLAPMRRRVDSGSKGMKIGDTM